MKWTSLRNVPTPDWLSDANRARAEQLNEAIASLIERRRKYDAEGRKLLETAVGELDGEVFDETIRRRWLFQILRDELALRRDLAEWVENAKRDWRAELSAGRKAIEEARNEVREFLVQIGYVNTPTFDSRVRGSITPAMVDAHPLVGQAHDRVRRAQADPLQQFIVLNNAELNAVDRALESMRDRVARV